MANQNDRLLTLRFFAAHLCRDCCKPEIQVGQSRRFSTPPSEKRGNSQRFVQCDTRRMTLTPDEFELVLKMRAKGRAFSYIEAEIGVCHDVIRRALAERGYSTAPIRKERRAKRGTGYWRSFD